MPTSAPGNKRPHCCRRRAPRGPGVGFTLVELLVVIAIVALTTSLIAVALRDSRVQTLEREADRLVLLLETARAESRATGLPVWWRPADPAQAEAGGFRFVGLPAASGLPTVWLDPAVQAQVEGPALLTLGPEALIGAQRVWLRLEDQRIAVATDGLAPFDVQPANPASSGTE